MIKIQHERNVVLQTLADRVCNGGLRPITLTDEEKTAVIWVGCLLNDQNAKYEVVERPKGFDND